MAFFVAVTIYFGVALVLPTLLAWRRSGVFPVVFHREAGSVQRLFGLLFGLFLGALLFWSVLCALVEPRQLGIWEVPVWVRSVGWLLFAVGLIVTAVAQSQMGRSWRIGIDDRHTSLVKAGLFKLSRNPIFSGMIISLFGGVLITPSIWSVLGFLLAVVLISVQVRLEEQHLLAMHSTDYAAYTAVVGRFVPLLGRLDNSEAK